MTTPPKASERETASALIIVCPTAENAVARHRRRYDRAAQFGVPAHVTVTHPFIPLPELEPDDDRLERLFLGFPALTMHGSRTDWFDRRVLFVALDEPEPVSAMTDAVTRHFPAYPPYGGAFDKTVPHLTIGHDQPPAKLEAAERDVAQRLPFEQVADRVELWAGPPTSGAIKPGSWRRARSYRLGGR